MVAPLPPQRTQRPRRGSLTKRSSSRPVGKFLHIIFVFVAIVVIINFVALYRLSGDATSTPIFVRRSDNPDTDSGNSVWWSGLQECKYEGNCPHGTTCVWNPRHSFLGGFCEPYLPDDAGGPVDPDIEECASVCRNDVEIDERFYFKAKVKIKGVVRALPSRGRPGGCVVLFQRQFKFYEEDVLFEEWRSDSREAIVRLDPVMTERNPTREGQAWAALCYAPCKNDNMCDTDNGSGSLQTKRSEEPPFFCSSEKGTCQRQRRWIPPNPDGFNDMVVVTGANAAYFSGLKNAVASLLYWAPKNKVVVYNLGMRSNQIEEVKKWPNVAAIEWEDGKPPSHHPNHIADVKMFAWKVIAIDESVRKYNMTFWTDAGSTITGPLDTMEKIIEQTGIFLTWGQDNDMTTWSMHGTYKYFGLKKDSFKGYPHYSGNTQGFLLPSPYADSVLGPTLRCALVRKCIDKPRKLKGDRGGHRYDQTVMSIIAYRPDIMPRHHTELLAASKLQLNQNLSQPSRRIVYTSRKACTFYSELMGW